MRESTMPWKTASILVLWLCCVSATTVWGQAEDLAEALRLSLKLNQAARQDNYTEVVRLGERLLAIDEKITGPEHPDTAHTLSLLGAGYLAIGDLSKAVQLCQRALAIQEKVLGSEHVDTLQSVALLASVYALMGNYAHALPLYQRALAIQEKSVGPDHPDFAQTLSGLAAVYEGMKDYPLAQRNYQQAFTIYEKVLGSGHLDTIDAMCKLAGVYTTIGNYTEAQTLYQRVLAIRERHSQPDNIIFVQAFSGLADVYVSLGDSTRALALLEQMVKVFNKPLSLSSPYLASLLQDSVPLQPDRGDLEKLIPRVEAMMAGAEKEMRFQPNAVAHFASWLARLYSATGNHEKAFQSLQRALAAEDQIFAQVFAAASEQQKVSFVEQSKWNYLAALELLRGRFSRDEKTVRWGLELVWRRKGMVLDVQSRVQQTLVDNLQGETLQSWQRLTQQRSALSNLLLRGPEEDQVSDYQYRIADLNEAIRKEEEYLALRSRIVTSEVVSRQSTTKLVADRLPAGSALVEFVMVRELDKKTNRWADTPHYLAFVLLPEDRVTLVDLGDATKIENTINETMAVIDNPQFRDDPKAYTKKTDAKLAELYNRLLHPLEPALGSAKRLIISPDAALNKVPFTALRTPDGHYLIEKVAVSYVTSGRDLLREGSEDEKPTVDLLLAASPAFDDQDVLRKTPDTDAVRAGDYGQRFDPLPGTAEEARVIPPLLAGTQQILQGKEATESAVRAIKSPRVLHLATHGFFLKDEEMTPPNPLSFAKSLLDSSMDRGKGGIQLLGVGRRSPLRVNPMVRSGLALAGANHARDISSGNDGILTALEVTGMNLYGTDLVVLSACNTAVGEVQVGEGVYGLRRAFVLAGAKNLVMSLWAVNDQVTLHQMEVFYRGYSHGKSPTMALRDAQLQTIATLRTRSKAELGEATAPVRLWAPFVVQQTGETKTTIATEIVGVEPVSLTVSQQPGMFADNWRPLGVVLMAMVGLVLLSRVRLRVMPAEMASVETATPVAVEQLLPSSLHPASFPEKKSRYLTVPNMLLAIFLQTQRKADKLYIDAVQASVFVSVDIISIVAGALLFRMLYLALAWRFNWIDRRMERPLTGPSLMLGVFLQGLMRAAQHYPDSPKGAAEVTAEVTFLLILALLFRCMSVMVRWLVRKIWGTLRGHLQRSAARS